MMVSAWLSNATEWLTSAFDQVEELLSAPASGEEANHLTAAGEQPYNRTGLISIILRLLSVSPLEAFNHAKGVVEQKLVSLHNLALDVGQAAAEVSQSATKQVLAGNFSHAVELIREHSEAVIDWFQFSEFQLKLIREFSLILLGNLVLLLLAWRIYGSRISSRFLRSKGGRRVIEELRESVSELELPEDYSFKYK